MSELESVIVTSCYGAGFWPALRPWVAHLRTWNEGPIEIISLEGGSYDGGASGVATVFAAPSAWRPGYGDGDQVRLARILNHLERGRICIQIDLDVRMKREFSVLSRLPYDFVISRAFAFPPFAAKQLGFVACTGFYIAKPTVLPLCVKLLGNLKERLHRDSHLNQYALNVMLCTAAEGGHQLKESIQLDGIGFDVDMFEVEACRIGVLPREAIERHPATNAGVFGNHHRALLDLFLADGFPQAGEGKLSGTDGLP